jgi:hypothetical protein
VKYEYRYKVYSKDRRRRVDTVANILENLLANNRMHKAYQYIENWYRSKKPPTTNPTTTQLDQIGTKFKNLYSAKEPTRPPLYTHVTYNINDDALDKNKFVEALYQL